MSLDIVSTNVDIVSSLINSIEEERSVKEKLIKDNITFPLTNDEKLNVIKTYASSLWMVVKTELYSNTKKDYAFISKPWVEKKQASISIWKDSNLWRLEITWSKKYAWLWYANTSSETWFSVFKEV